MIVRVSEENLDAAARLHALCWQESHRSFCSAEFVAAHTPLRQAQYLRNKMEGGTKVFLLLDPEPVGIVSVTDNLIEDLYILPHKQRRGCGTRLLQYAVNQCRQVPMLWILENNRAAAKLYVRMGFRPTGRINSQKGKLTEIEYSLQKQPDCL